MNPPIPEVAYVLLIPVALALSWGLSWLMEGFTRIWYRPVSRKRRDRR